MYVCVREFRTFLFHMEMSATRNALHSTQMQVCVCVNVRMFVCVRMPCLVSKAISVCHDSCNKFYAHLLANSSWISDMVFVSGFLLRS